MADSIELDSSTDRLSAYGQLLLNVALQFGGTLDLDQLLSLVLEQSSRLLKADRALFALFDDKGGIERSVAYNLKLDTDGGLPVSQTVIDEVRRTGLPIAIGDVSITDYNKSNSVQILGLHFIMVVPIPSQGRVIGVLYLDSQTKQTSNLTSETELIVAISRLIGTAVENARLFRHQRYRTHLLGALVHDFRTPLSVILANAELLAQPLPDDDRVAMAADIAACARRMSYMVASTLELAQSDTPIQRSFPINVDLTAIIPRHVRGLNIVAETLDLSLVLAPNLADLPSIRTIPDRIWIILDNLLFNAIKHALPGTAVTISMRTRTDAGPQDALERPLEQLGLFSRQQPLFAIDEAGFVEITIHNYGTPIPPALLPTLFQAYTIGEMGRPGLPQPTGLGLSIADQCVHHLGGRVWVRSSQKDGTAFSFSLPIDVNVGSTTSQPQSDHDDTVPMTTFFPEDPEHSSEY